MYSAKTVPISELQPSEFHIRGWTNVDEQFVRNVGTVGLIQPPIVRNEDGTFGIIDGVRRVEAARQAGFDEVKVLVSDLTDNETLELSITANLDVWYKQTSDSDREKALRQFVGEPAKQIREWEQQSGVREARYKIGLESLADRIEYSCTDISGVGRVSAERLAERFDSLEQVKTATEDELQSVEGIGQKTAQRIRSYFNN